MYPINLNNFPDGFELIDDKVPFDQKKHLQLTICYSTIDGQLATDPIYNLDYYLEKTKQFIGLGADSVCIKDMGGTAQSL